MSMTFQEFAEAFDDAPVNLCAGGCGTGLDILSGRHELKDGSYCDDCYYEKLGELVEQHPITSPRVRHGIPKMSA